MIKKLLKTIDLYFWSFAIGVPIREIPDFVDFVKVERRARRKEVDHAPNEEAASDE